MQHIDLIIPCYGEQYLINRALASISTQWKREYIHVTLVNDCSPNTDNDYQELVDVYKDVIDIQCIKTPKNVGQGLARQYGIDHTYHDWILFIDEDDQLGSGIAASCFCNPIEMNGKFLHEETGDIICDPETGEPVTDENCPKIALVSAPLFEFDEFHSTTIPAENTVWPTAKLYNREFLNKHNIRFNERQSRHAEDYFFTSCFFYALEHDREYMGALLDNDGMYYIWYPNENSQSRKDPHYGFMLAGYTMDGSVNILNYMKDIRLNNTEWNEEIESEYKNRLLNMTVYSYYTFISFIDHYWTTDFEPTEEDWDILRYACKELRDRCKECWSHYRYYQILGELVHVRENSDVQWCTAPEYKHELEFDKYILDGCKYFNWSYEELVKQKEANPEEFGVEVIKIEEVIEENTLSSEE